MNTLQDTSFDWMLGAINQTLRQAGGASIDSVDLIHSCGLEEADAHEYLCQLFNDALEWGEAAGWFGYSLGGWKHLKV